MATAQGVYLGVLTGIAMAGVTFAAGPVAEMAGAAAAYWLAVGLSAVCLAAALMLGRAWRGRAVVAG